MRLITFQERLGETRSGVLLDDIIIDIAAAAPLVFEGAEEMTWTISDLLRSTQDVVSLDSVHDIVVAVLDFTDSDGDDSIRANGLSEPRFSDAAALSIGGVEMLRPVAHVTILAPLPRPESLRLFDTFEEHAIARYAHYGRSLPPAWYHHMPFSFGNCLAISGPDATVAMPVATSALDYQFGLACVVGHHGSTLSLDEAQNAIVAYTMLNVWCARDIESDMCDTMHGSANAAGFAVSLGPWLVTPDELEPYMDDDGRLALTMTGRIDEVEQARSNSVAMYHTFAELLVHVSHRTPIAPGEVFWSGTVPGGCLLDITQGTGPWLQAGHVLTLEATGLGCLRTTII